MDAFNVLRVFINTMIDTQEKEMMEKFLKMNYPIYRLKHKMKFKRTIVLESGERYHLSNKDTIKDLYFKLKTILNLVFCPRDSTMDVVLNDFLHLKKH